MKVCHHANMQISLGESKLIPGINICYMIFNFLDIFLYQWVLLKGKSKHPFSGDVNSHRRQWNQDFCLNFTFISK